MVRAEAIAHLFPGITFGARGECYLADDGAGPYIKTWSRPEPQPTEAEIEAAALPVLAALEQTRLDSLADEQSRQRAKAAYTQLQTIVDGIDGATLAQAKTAIKQIAQISQDLIRATVGR